MEFARQRFGGDGSTSDLPEALSRPRPPPAPPRTQPEPERCDDEHPPERHAPPPVDPKSPQEAGTSRGINIAPGSDDDGWVVPPPVTLSDGTRVQLYKDGEALHAAYEAIKGAKRRVCLESYIFADDDTGRAFAAPSPSPPIRWRARSRSISGS